MNKLRKSFTTIAVAATIILGSNGHFAAQTVEEMQAYCLGSAIGALATGNYQNVPPECYENQPVQRPYNRGNSRPSSPSASCIQRVHSCLDGCDRIPSSDYMALNYCVRRCNAIRNSCYTGLKSILNPTCKGSKRLKSKNFEARN